MTPRRIRPFRSGDEAAIGEICVRTAASGSDATGVLADDDLWPAVYAWPYVRRHPDTAFVVEADDGAVAGYIISAPDTDAFERWFADRWWPQFAARWPRPASAQTEQDLLLQSAYERGVAPSPFQALGYPAHLHIDLLPQLQGQGCGRRLIETLAGRLTELGVAGVHLTAVADNAGAVAFYPRVGFVPLSSEPGGRSFGMRLPR
ncbi:hypothetical protein GCM10022240_18580 [Microbacterium kribbense]|uniref:N-acetyltransferase domain-containing protein n=1 Tax=Microbacterium kribbense TaxID=433645 RepID=A0ABP7GJN3_9MICO